MFYNNIRCCRSIVIRANNIHCHRICTVRKRRIYLARNSHHLFFLIHHSRKTLRESIGGNRIRVFILEHERFNLIARSHRLFSRTPGKRHRRRHRLMLHRNFTRYNKTRIRTTHRNGVVILIICKRISNFPNNRISHRRVALHQLQSLRNATDFGTHNICIFIDNRSNCFARRHRLRGIVTNERKYRHNRLMLHHNFCTCRGVIIRAVRIHGNLVFFVEKCSRKCSRNRYRPFGIIQFRRNSFWKSKRHDRINACALEY